MHAAQPSDETQARQEVQGVVEAFAEAWNAHDMDAFSRLFAAGATWVNVRGSRWVGADEIKASHAAVHARFYGNSRLAFDDVSIRFLSPTIAVVHAEETITGSTVPAAAGLSPDSQMSLVVVHDDGRWRIATDTTRT